MPPTSKKFGRHIGLGVFGLAWNDWDIVDWVIKSQRKKLSLI